MPKTESSSTFEFRDWAHLPPEIVELISSKVKSITDYVRFRAICSPWRSASHPKPRHHLPPQLPWLMLPYNRLDPTCVYFDDIWESKRRKFRLPEAKGLLYLASYRGWILLADNDYIFWKAWILLNPLTRARIELPSAAHPVKLLKYDLFDVLPRHLPRRSPKGTKVTFSADLTDPNCLITVLLERHWVICCRVGDPYWTWVNHLDTAWVGNETMLSDATYYNGRFYLLQEESMNSPQEHCMTIIESDTSKIFLMPELKAVRFLEGKSGVYVLVVRRKFELYQLLDEPLMLKQITDTSNNTAILYGDNYPCLAVCADDWDSLDGGSVYTEKKCVQNASKCIVGSHYSIYSAQCYGQKIEHMVPDLGKEPQFQAGEPVMWFQPSFV